MRRRQATDGKQQQIGPVPSQRNQSGIKLLSMPNFVSLIQPATRSAASGDAILN
jgi:hypothetical protein